VASGLVAFLGAFLLVDAAFRGSWVVFWVALGPIASVVWALWLLTFRPAILVDDHAVTVLNPLRTTRIPWSAVAAVRLRWQVLVETGDGRIVRCWGGPVVQRPRPVRRGTLSVPQDAAALPAITDRWRERRGVRPADGTVVRGWDRPAAVSGILVGTLLVVTAVVGLLAA